MLCPAGVEIIPDGAQQANPTESLLREIKVCDAFDDLELHIQREGFSLLPFGFISMPWV